MLGAVYIYINLITNPNDVIGHNTMNISEIFQVFMVLPGLTVAFHTDFLSDCHAILHGKGMRDKALRMSVWKASLTETRSHLFSDSSSQFNSLFTLYKIFT